MRKIGYLIFAIIMFGGVAFLSLHRNQESHVQSTWVWDTSEFQSNQQTYFSFLEEKGITKLYVQIDPELPVGQYEAMIRNARSKEIDVFAIDGAKEWVYSRDTFIEVLDWLDHYQTVVKEPARFTGLLLDVEPYLLEEWETEQERLLQGYQEIIRAGSVYANRTEIPFEMAIPFWFNTITISNEPLLDWMSSYVDTFVIMSYRTELEGVNGLHAIVRPYFTEFQFEDVDVVLTVETERLAGEERSITFAEKEESDLNTFIKKIYSFYKTEESFQGISIHHLQSWIKIVDNEKE